MTSEKELQSVVDFVKQTVGDATRLRILSTIASAAPKGMYVNQIARHVDIPMVNTSHHLAMLKNAGVIENEKEGRSMVYTLNPDKFKVNTDKNSALLGSLSIGGFKFQIPRNIVALPGEFASGIKTKTSKSDQDDEEEEAPKKKVGKKKAAAAAAPVEEVDEDNDD